MSETVDDYTPPVADLLTLGDVRQIENQYNYLAHGFTAAHIPELQRMALDEELSFADSESDLVWAPLHAWRTLGQLRDPAAIPTMIELIYKMEDWEDDWSISEVPQVLGLLGAPAIEPLQQALSDDQLYLYGRVAAAEALAKIAMHYPTERARVVAILAEQLRRFAEEEDDFNAFLVGVLIDLQAVEAADVMAAAFAANKVDWSIQGDWEEVQIALGLLTERITPRPARWSFPDWEPSEEEPIHPRDLFALPQRSVDAQREKRRKAKKMAKQTKQKQRAAKKKKRK